MARISIAHILALACSLQYAAAQTFNCYDATGVKAVQSSTNPNLYTITGAVVANQTSCYTIPVTGTGYLPSADASFTGEPGPVEVNGGAEHYHNFLV